MADVQSTTVLDVPWWYAVHDYESEDEAKADFDRVNTMTEEEQGPSGGLAGYRILDDWAEQGGRPRRVVVLGAIEEKVVWAARQLGGTPVLMDADVVYGLIARRIRFLANADEMQIGPGHYTFRHGESGMRINKDGTVEMIPSAPSTEPDIGGG